MDNSQKKSKLICRKCGGGHLTIKCGKPKKKLVEVKKSSHKKNSYKKGSHKKNSYKKGSHKKNSYKKGSHKKNNYKKGDYKDRRNYRRNYDDGINKTKVKINNLPNDIDVRELNTLMQPWGKIGRISIMKRYSCYSIIDFYNKDEAEYFVKALHNTGFEHRILHVEILAR